MKCTDCHLDFPFLDTVRCAKCCSRVGKSNAEIHHLNSLPQCQTCGLVKADLSAPLCNKCHSYCNTLSAIPREVIAIPNAINQLNLTHTTESENSGAFVMQAAASFQQNASSVRLGLPVPRKANSSLVKAIGASASVIRERKDKRENAGNLTIRLGTALWQMPAAVNNIRGKMQQITQIHHSGVYQPHLTARSVLEDLLSRTRIDFAREFPQGAELNWQTISLYGHESTAKYHSLESHHSNGTIEQFANNVALVCGKNPAHRQIEVRFVYKAEVIFDRSDAEDPASDGDNDVPMRRGKRNKRKALLSSSDSGADRPARKVSRTGHVTLYSAWRPNIAAAPVYVRNPPMREYSFTRTTAKVGKAGGVVFSTSSEEEGIEIATDWPEGELMWKDSEPFRQTGFIGQGYTKRAIYCRFQGQEMALTQIMGEGGESELLVENLLKAEYRLLCIGDSIKEHFDKWAAECEIVVPKFSFNFANSIFGCLKSLRESGGRHVPFKHFIATPLLPCGDLDSGLQKFTGSDSVGDAPNDMTKAIHAFAHFGLVYTRNSLLFCDLQGLFDDSGNICLIDPQSHTDTTEAHRREVYWDRGPKFIQLFVEQHSKACSNNWICTGLNLATIVVQDEKLTTPKKARPSGPLRHGFSPP